ncbi:MAG: tyrosine-type recombinase/integrase [Solibacillus sp.]
MFFKQIEKNTWVCVADGPPDPVTGKRRQISRRGKTKTEAKDKVEKAIVELQSTLSYNAKIKFLDFSKDWLNLYKLKGNKETTVEHRKYCISLLNKYMANIKVTAITPIIIQNTLNSLFDNKTAYFTLRGTHNAAKMIFHYAKEIGLISVNPVEGVFIPKKKLAVEDVDGTAVSRLFLNTDELKEFLCEVDKHRNIFMKTLIYTIAFTGMRPGEALALTHKDINFEKKQITITKTMYAKKSIRGDFSITPPKTYNSIRTIDIDDILVEKLKILDAARTRQKWIKSEYFFGEVDGIPTTVKMLNAAVRRIGASTSVDKQFRTYILRHTHISLLAEAEVDLNYIMNRVGHKNSATTTQIYLHVTNGMRNTASAKMHAKFTELLHSSPQK